MLGRDIAEASDDVLDNGPAKGPWCRWHERYLRIVARTLSEPRLMWPVPCEQYRDTASRGNVLVVDHIVFYRALLEDSSFISGLGSSYCTCERT